MVLGHQWQDLTYIFLNYFPGCLCEARGWSGEKVRSWADSRCHDSRSRGHFPSGCNAVAKERRSEARRRLSHPSPCGNRYGRKYNSSSLAYKKVVLSGSKS